MNDNKYVQLIDEKDPESKLYQLSTTASKWTEKNELKTLRCKILDESITDKLATHELKNLALKKFLLKPFEELSSNAIHERQPSFIRFFKLLENIEKRDDKSKCNEKEVVEMISCLLDTLYPLIFSEQERKLLIESNYSKNKYITSRSDLECVYKDMINLVVEVKDVNNTSSYSNWEMQLLASMLCQAQLKFKQFETNYNIYSIQSVRCFGMLVFGYNVQFYRCEIEKDYIGSLNKGIRPKNELRLYKLAKPKLSLLEFNDRRLLINILDFFKEN